MTITISSLNAGDEKFNRLLAFLDGNDIVYSTKAALPQADVSGALVCKECQKRLITEIMRDDEQAGIYDQ